MINPNKVIELGNEADALRKEIAELKEDIKYKDEHIDALGKYFKPKIKVLCCACSQEFELKLFGEYATMRQTISNFENCPHCGERNDTWVAVEWLDKQSLAIIQAEGIEKMMEVIKVGFRINWSGHDEVRVSDVMGYAAKLKEGKQ